MATFKILTFSYLRKFVNVNDVNMKTFPFPPLSILIYIYFYLYINVHTFTLDAESPFLLTLGTLPLTKSNVHTNGNMFTL